MGVGQSKEIEEKETHTYIHTDIEGHNLINERAWPWGTKHLNSSEPS